MKKITIILWVLLGFSSILTIARGQTVSGFKVAKTFHIASSGGWDYISVGPSNNRIYVSHGSQVNILNEQTGDSVGVIPNTTGVHGIAFYPAAKKGYTSNGRLNTVTVFDLETNNVLAQIQAGQNPDAIMFEPFSKKIITCNGRSQDLSVIDPETNAVVATIAVGGKPETAVSDGAGKIYVNIEDKNEIIEINIQTNKVENRWPLAPTEGPTGLAMDVKTKRLFAGCEKTLVIMNAENGKIIDRVTIGNGCDGVGFDSKLGYVFASCGEGTLAVVHEVSANEFKLIENVPTKRSARTIAVDEYTHQVFLPAADMDKNSVPGERPKMLPGTFQIVVVSK